MEILVTGASGYIGSELIPRLAADGHSVRAFGRQESRVAAALPEGTPSVPVHTGDVVTGAGLDAALEGCDAAYFLIHSMEPGDESFGDRDRRAAELDQHGLAGEALDIGQSLYKYAGGLGRGHDVLLFSLM